MNNMNTAGDYYPSPYGQPQPWQQPHRYGTYSPPAYYGTETAGWNFPPLTEDRIREIFREELAKALEAMKAKG